MSIKRTNKTLIFYIIKLILLRILKLIERTIWSFCFRKKYNRISRACAQSEKATHSQKRIVDVNTRFFKRRYQCIRHILWSIFIILRNCIDVTNAFVTRQDWLLYVYQLLCSATITLIVGSHRKTNAIAMNGQHRSRLLTLYRSANRHVIYTYIYSLRRE